MKLISVDNYEKDANKWVATFDECSKKNPIKKVLFGTGEKTYVDNGDVLKRSKYRSENECDEKCNVDTCYKLKYYLLYGDSTNIQVNLKQYKGVFKV